MSSIGNLAGSLLQSVLGVGVLSNNNTSTVTNTASSSSTPLLQGTGQLSVFAQLAAKLQQLLQNYPAQYQQVTQQIATNLQTAAQKAQSGGNTTAAAQLNQLATDFTSASTSGQLPNLQDLAQAVGGHHGHHHHLQLDSGDGSSSSTSTSSSASTSPALSQLLASLQANTVQNGSLNPSTIIQNTLANAGVSIL